jgi:hypothetical protein
MTATATQTTIYFDPQIHIALKIKAAQLGLSLSKLLNNWVNEKLSEDQEDLVAFKERANEVTVSYEDFLAGLKQDGII